LQPGGIGSSGANSPFPAPSSIGTTPVGGTPEPQAQNEDGEETPHEQISLIEGGPGEEDETTLHEVRAKAIVYVPVAKDGDDDGSKKSPWVTKGVGPLRLLKNKSTGTVRALLRAEPRGHIALNKTILADVDYKAKEKTVNFLAAKDDGSGLETWVLQVKKPEFAQQLAQAMEDNKSANKH
jgi:nucleoporin NUP2